MEFWAYFWEIVPAAVVSLCFIFGMVHDHQSLTYDNWPLNTRPRSSGECQHLKTEPVTLALGQHVADLCLACGKTIYIAGWEL